MNTTVTTFDDILVGTQGSKFVCTTLCITPYSTCNFFPSWPMPCIWTSYGMSNLMEYCVFNVTGLGVFMGHVNSRNFNLTNRATHWKLTDTGPSDVFVEFENVVTPDLILVLGILFVKKSFNLFLIHRLGFGMVSTIS